MTFHDRRSAGRVLAHELKRFAADKPVVIALPRGGVPVAFEIADALKAPLDVFGAHKLGAPMNPEFAIGAVAEDGTAVIDRKAVLATQSPELDISRESKAVARRADLYRRGKPMIAIAGRTTILTDDGLATGLTDLAAVRALRQMHPARIVLAVPVAAPSSLSQIAAEADDVVCPLVPPLFESVGRWYDDFSPVSDDEVLDLLEQARARTSA